MNPKVVFFGGPDYGKSTIIGRMIAEVHNINMENVEKKLREEMGANYLPDYLYSSFVNPHQAESLRRGERANSKQHEIKNIKIDDTAPIVLIDTPGHDKYISGRQLGMSMSDIGVYCLAIEKVLDDDFGGIVFTKYSDLFSEYHPNGKLIYLLTMFDVMDYGESYYLTACEKIKEKCRWVEINHVEEAFGVPIEVDYNDIDAAAIIPVAVEFKTKEKEGINIFSRNEKTSWYSGLTLIEAIRIQIGAMEMDAILSAQDNGYV